MGIITLILLITLESFFLIWTIKTKNNHREEKAIIRIGIIILFGLLFLSGILIWSFRYSAILLVLILQTFWSTYILVKRKEIKFKIRKIILLFISNGLVFTLALSLAIIFPQYKQPETTGSYEVSTKRFTWVDYNRSEEFSKLDEKRALTVEFWYPKSTDKTYPLVVFSHGAFGFSGSNYSTFAELASNGYVVASIGHTYQAFYTQDTNGKITTVDTDFINKAAKINSIYNTQEEIYNITKQWMELRTSDENFVIDKILDECKTTSAETLFRNINKDKIGLIGHSLGGASSAQIGRERNDIDAVIVLDGTMLGEEIGFKDNKLILNETPYPIPLLNIYAQDHYTNSKKLVGDNYNNFFATKNALQAYEIVFKDSGHLNFTDLPLFSPLIAKALGVGTIDEDYCIETMNKIVLEFFNSFLKDTGEPKIEKEY